MAIMMLSGGACAVTSCLTCRFLAQFLVFEDRTRDMRDKHIRGILYYVHNVLIGIAPCLREDIAVLERRLQMAERSRQELKAKTSALHAQLTCVVSAYNV